MKRNFEEMGRCHTDWLLTQDAHNTRDQQKIVNRLVIVTVTKYNNVTVTKSWEKPCYNRIKGRNLVDLLQAGTGLLPNVSAISGHET
jgi:hypothetical protein